MTNFLSYPVSFFLDLTLTDLCFSLLNNFLLSLLQFLIVLDNRSGNIFFVLLPFDTKKTASVFLLISCYALIWRSHQSFTQNVTQWYCLYSPQSLLRILTFYSSISPSLHWFIIFFFLNAHSQGVFIWPKVFSWWNLYLQCRCPHLNYYLQNKGTEVSKALLLLPWGRCLK